MDTFLIVAFCALFAFIAYVRGYSTGHRAGRRKEAAVREYLATLPGEIVE